MKVLAINRHPALIRRLGSAAFVFFLVKGLMWLAAPFLYLWLT